LPGGPVRRSERRGPRDSLAFLGPLPLARPQLRPSVPYRRASMIEPHETLSPNDFAPREAVPLQGGISWAGSLYYTPPMRPNLPKTIKLPTPPAITEATFTFQRMRDRLGVVCPVMFASPQFIGEGVLHNLSRTGCRVECDRSVRQGSYITIRLLLPSSIQALRIEVAAVRWTHERYFGMEFLRLPLLEQARLQQFLSYHQCQ
jgi:PilZ domain